MYIEYVLIENFIIDFFIIYCVQKILREKSKFIWVGSILGSIIAILCPLFNLNLLASIVIKVASSIMISTFCFKVKKIKNYFINYFLFLIVTFVFGGATELIKQAFGEVTILITLSTCFVVFLVFRGVISFLNRKKVVDNFSTKVYIIDGEKKIEENGYYDTGNLLYDPITSKPICLITHEVFVKLYGGDVVSLFMKKIDEKKLKNGHYISVKSAVKEGKMLVFDVDKIIVEGKEEKVFKNVCLGLSFSGFDKAMNSKILLHSSQTC